MSALPQSTATRPAPLTAPADPIVDLFATLRSDATFFAVRLVEEDSETLAVRKGVPQPFARRIDRGAMVTVIDQGAYGYAATADISRSGLQGALDRAHAWARASSASSVVRFPTPADDAPRGHYVSPLELAMPSRRDLFALVASVDAAAQIDARVVDSFASVEICTATHRYLTNHGGDRGSDITQIYRFVLPNIQVSASDGHDTQTRSLAGQYNGFCQQGGAEVLARAGFEDGGARVARDAIDLLEAPNCPSGKMDLLLMPDQMMLQIHESIGHPLELDRILGDERNFAGTSFVTLDMFGHYQYGSPLLNVSFDPTRSHQFASYAFDDEGTPAKRELLIKEGVLVKPLGGALSQARAKHLLGEHVDLGGVANTRSSSWNRAPIDRMANLNIEPGTSSLDEMIASIERGVMMKTNVSWSIDDSRNKFQFGCEWGRLIENGKLTSLVKNPNYRGVSANFWRSLEKVGDESTVEIMGTPFCGKGEPSQVIRVGHASPACLFAEVDVFGAEGAV